MNITLDQLKEIAKVASNTYSDRELDDTYDIKYSDEFQLVADLELDNGDWDLYYYLTIIFSDVNNIIVNGYDSEDNYEGYLPAIRKMEELGIIEK